MNRKIIKKFRNSNNMNINDFVNFIIFFGVKSL